MGHLDSWHGLVKVLEHSDRLEEDTQHGLVSRYYLSARLLRKHGAFGQGQKVMQAVANRQGEHWRRPVPIQQHGTRTPLFEVDRVPLNYIGNFRAAVLGYAALIEASRHGADYSPAKQYRAAGRLLMDMEVLLFICFRYDSRRPLVHHATICQSLSTSGFERVRREFAVLLKLWDRIGAVQEAIGLVRTSAFLFACTGRAQDGRRPPHLSTRTIYSFLLCAAQRSGLYRKMPNMTMRLLELLCHKSFLGVSIGYKLPRGSELPGPRGWALLPFDNVEKQKQRFARGVAKTPSSFGRTQHARLAFLREELHLDVKRVLERLFQSGVKAKTRFTFCFVHCLLMCFGRVSSSLCGLLFNVLFFFDFCMRKVSDHGQA